MQLGLGIRLSKHAVATLEYVPIGYDAFITADNEQFVTYKYTDLSIEPDLFAWLFSNPPETSENKDFNVLEP